MLRNVLRTSRWLAQKSINKALTIPVCKHILERNVLIGHQQIIRNTFSSSSSESQHTDHIDQVVFEEICNETLESLCEYFEEIVDQESNFKGADVTFSDGVLTVALGHKYGTYVINRQTPNKQIWLSSPVSGPKRYDLILKDGGYWIYKHDGVSLHQLLQNEISKIVNSVDFTNCAHSLV